MKSNLLSVLIILVAFAFTPPVVTKKVDVTASTLEWKAYKVTGQHAGTIQLKSGELVYENDQLTGGKFTVDMTAIAVTDMQGKGAERLKGHLESPDFFNIAEHPTASFTITKAIAYADGKYKIEGNMTIKDITKEVKFIAETTEDGDITADIQIDRSDFDVRYGSGSFFDNLGDKTIYDEFDLSVTLVIDKEG